ncbi:MAG TPA: hypothetical protein ENN19_19170, partial [Chloroflexi bacterium]|nr:hypothetical protein [Chloroflexota bacterium]
RFPYRGSVLAIHVVRLLTVIWGMGAIVGAYHLAREIVPGRPTLALAAAAFTAFNPHFIFISSVVNNDACAACLCTWVLWLTVRLVQRTGTGPRDLYRLRFVSKCSQSPSRGRPMQQNTTSEKVSGPETPPRTGARSVITRVKRYQGLSSAAILGILLGLALLSKMSALALVTLVGLALALAWWRERDVEALLVRGALVFGLAALLGAWWYVRNWVLYGDPLAWDVWLSDIAESSIGPLELVRQLGHVATSYWSPYDGLFPAWVFWGLGLLALVAIVGWLRMARQIVQRPAGAREPLAAFSTAGLLLAGVWFVMLFASLVKYMLTTPSDEGRLLFPGIAAFSLLLALGIDLGIGWALPRRRAQAALLAVGVGTLALGALTPFFAIVPRYALPLLASAEAVPTSAFPVDETFGDVHLLGIDVSPDEAGRGDTVWVTLYWKALAPPPDDLRAVVQVWTLGGRLIGQQDMTPAGEIYPPDLWQPGDVVRDPYGISIDENESVPAMCWTTVRVMLGDELLGSASLPAALRLKASPPPRGEMAYPADRHQAVTLGHQVVLEGYTLPDPLPAAGEPLTVTLYWRNVAPLLEDYVVFVHLFDGAGHLIAQGDGPPMNGDYPTTYWMPDDVLADPHIVPLANGLPAGARLQVGLYRLGDGARLPVYDGTDERVPNDAIVLNVTAD